MRFKHHSFTILVLSLLTTLVAHPHPAEARRAGLYGSSTADRPVSAYTAADTDSAGTRLHEVVVTGTRNYSLCRPVRLWVKGENLLAQRSEYLAGMPMPRATFMAGMNIEF
ncbi:MAG: hypothetical protein ACI353_03325 [Alloprevotella sp.]